MATTQELLDEAIAVRHAWRTGKTTSTVTHGERTISYSIEGMKRLDAYIAELRRLLAGPAPRGRNRIQYVTPR